MANNDEFLVFMEAEDSVEGLTLPYAQRSYEV